MGGLLHSVQRGGDWHRPLLAAPNVTAHPSTASVPITVLLYNGPLLCGFNVAIKGCDFAKVADHHAVSSDSLCISYCHAFKTHTGWAKMSDKRSFLLASF